MGEWKFGGRVRLGELCPRREGRGKFSYQSGRFVKIEGERRLRILRKGKMEKFSLKLTGQVVTWEC